VLVIVLWVAFGLVAVTLYFANSMGFELRASENRAAGLAAEQAVEAGARYAAYVLGNWGTNGAVPDYTLYYREAVPVGEAHFWFVGRNPEYTVPSAEPFFALVDEGSKLNLNTVSSNMIELLPRMTLELVGRILEWRSTNSLNAQTYAMLRPPYQCKSTNYESIDELRLVYGANMDILAGEDLNRNGVLDPNEYDENRNNLVDPGLLEYVTVHSREPNTGRTNVNNRQQLVPLLQQTYGTARANQILARLGPTTTTFRSPLQFYQRSGMTVDEFGLIGTNLTTASGTYIRGRVNVNTASPMVLACLPGMTADLALQLASYRESNPARLTSVAWVAEALGQNNATALQSLAAGDYITTQSYQFTADVAALGPHGRGYRRVRFVFDLSNGSPALLYRQDLTHLGWALGKTVRQTWLLAKGTR